MVRSLVRELVGRKFPRVSSFPYQVVWMRHVPTKVAGFVWQVAHGKVSTIDNLVQRGMMIPNRCVLCGVDAESTVHLFRECSFACQMERDGEDLSEEQSGGSVEIERDREGLLEERCGGSVEMERDGEGLSEERCGRGLAGGRRLFRGANLRGRRYEMRRRMWILVEEGSLVESWLRWRILVEEGLWRRSLVESWPPKGGCSGGRVEMMATGEASSMDSLEPAPIHPPLENLAPDGVQPSEAEHDNSTAPANAQIVHLAKPLLSENGLTNTNTNSGERDFSGGEEETSTPPPQPLFDQDPSSQPRFDQASLFDQDPLPQPRFDQDPPPHSIRTSSTAWPLFDHAPPPGLLHRSPLYFPSRRNNFYRFKDVARAPSLRCRHNHDVRSSRLAVKRLLRTSVNKLGG
ncbi:hypothetical protein LINPERHAP1_LOCUS21182 [Linum perenne]